MKPEIAGPTNCHLLDWSSEIVRTAGDGGAAGLDDSSGAAEGADDGAGAAAGDVSVARVGEVRSD